MASCHETESESLYVWGPTYDVVNLGPVSLSFSFLDAIGRQLLQREMALVVIKIIRTLWKKKREEDKNHMHPQVAQLMFTFIHLIGQS